MADPVYVIAEAGSTHDGDLGKAITLIDIAARAGASACKFQWWSNPERLADRRGVPPAYREVYRRYAVTSGWLPILAAQCTEMGLEFLATTYLPEDVEVVAHYVRRFKIASFEAGNRAHLLAHNAFPQPVILSTGAMTLFEVRDSLALLQRPDALLHCASAYPARPDDLNLRSIGTLAIFGYPVGFSDHSASVLTGALAVAAGARLLEVHVKADDTDPSNPDAGHSLTPAELREYVRGVRFAEAAMGDGVKRAMPGEAAMARYAVPEAAP